MSHVINIKTKMTELKFLVATLKSLKLEFEVANIEQRTTIIIKDSNYINQAAFIWNGENFSFVSDPVWSNEEQINRFLVSINKAYNKIAFISLATQTNFIPTDTQINPVKETIALERFNYK